MKLLAILTLAALTGCDTVPKAVHEYNSHVAAREDSLSGYAKDNSYGGQWTHRVEYDRAKP